MGHPKKRHGRQSPFSQATSFGEYVLYLNITVEAFGSRPGEAPPDGGGGADVRTDSEVRERLYCGGGGKAGISRCSRREISTVTIPARIATSATLKMPVWSGPSPRLTKSITRPWLAMRS